MAARNQQQPSMAPVVVPATIAAATFAGWYGYPALIVLLAGLIFAAWVEPPALLTGKKDASGYPTAANPREAKQMLNYQFWASLKWRLLVPSSDWLPSWPPQMSTVFAVAATVAAAHLPVNVNWFRSVNAVAAYLLVTVVTAARRRTIVEDDISPGVTVDQVANTVRSSHRLMIAGGVSAVVSFILVATVTTPVAVRFAPGVSETSRVNVPDVPMLLGPTLLGVVAAFTAFVAVVTVPTRREALAHWREVVAARAEWKPRWLALKHDPAPRLTDRQHVGPAQVDTFDAPAGTGAMGYWQLGPKIAPTLGAGGKLAVLDVPDEDHNGPIPGTRHPLRFEIVTWPANDIPSLADTDLDEDTAALLARCSMMWCLDPLGYGRPVLTSVEKLTVDGSPSAWATRWVWPNGPTLNEIRPLTGDLCATFGCDVLVDHRNDVIYVGALLDPEVEFIDAPDGPDYGTVMHQLSTEDRWNSMWSQVLKSGANPPTIQHATYGERSLSDGTVVYRQAFLTRLGIDPMDFKGLEPKLATANRAAPYVAICGWPGKGDRPGERHPQAFVVYWAETPVPATPEGLAPSPAAQWVLAGRVNQAFDAARLARPEIVTANALTDPRSRRGTHLWQITLRLYGGVTLADVRGQAHRLRQAMGTAWLRVDAAADGCVIFAGGEPSQVRLANPDRDRLRLEALDWSQAFIDAGVTGTGGQVPTLVRTDTLPNNDQVKVLDFRLPPGVDQSKVKNGLGKLRSATGNEFIETRTGPDASTVRLLASVSNPLPATVPLDFDLVDTSQLIPFATGVEGEPVEFDPGDSPHILIAGVTGAGKSVAAQVFLYGALVRGWDAYVIDPVKGGADFQFAKDRCRAFASTPFEAAAVMRAVYDEVVRRKDLNASHGVGSYKDLPEDLRPPHLLVFIDEFTSLLGKSPVPPVSDDPEMVAERELIEAENQARLEVGVFTGKLAREARSAGVTLALGTQKLAAKMLDTIPGGASDLKTNLARMLLGKASTGDRMSALRAFDDAPPVAGDIPKGRGLWEPLTSSAELIQVWFAPQPVLREQLISRVRELPDDDKLDLSKYLRVPDVVEDRPTSGFGPVAASSEPEVVDLGELAIGFDDLDLAEDATDTGDGVDLEWVVFPEPNFAAANDHDDTATGDDEFPDIVNPAPPGPDPFG